MKIPQVTPDWETGIFIGNGTIATKRGNIMSKKYIAEVNNFETQELEVFHVEANSLDEAIRKLQDIYEPSSNGDHWSDYEPSEFTKYNVKEEATS